MKNIFFVVLFTGLLFAGQAFSQKTEVLYFKADLPCCKARACNRLENQVKQVVNSEFEADEVAFVTVKISDESNSGLVEEFDAESQTVIIVNSDKETSVDISDMVDNLKKTRNLEDFKEEFVNSIKEL